jgi:hypothetical protein
MTARPRAVPALVFAFALTALAAPAASATAVLDPGPVGPNQYFTATVNPGSASTGTTPVIVVACPGPVGGTGHPIAGQSVEASLLLPPITSTAVGFTGSAAHEIDVLFSGSAVTPATNPPIVISTYFVKVPIPTTLNLPCGGTGVVSFVPIPTSSTARGYAVKVEYANIAV